ncbi:hybrid sensor histidine kinase/response regulator transcription factor [Pedobacter sp. UBA5917]|uniref:hybrid sensor histidine kinase/response regulator transcription factor n=1 Tax=Pedobacter sp. UBA5917 TaxID=1947061 RepID=UPI0025DEF6B2|nr:two-component regulator propeller domain-containing protein [Pedobacter sp. UBA5917]
MRFFLIIPLLLLPFLGKSSEPCGMDFSQHYSFRYLSVNNGLSQNSITAIIQDKKGFIWIGTYDGLNRFDGFTIQTKRHISNNRNSLSDNRVLSLFENKKGEILIGTDGGGMNILDPRLDSISHFDIKQNDIMSNTVQAITTDGAGNIWAGTAKGLAIISPDKRENQVFFPAELKTKNIRSLLTDKKGNIWVATTQGLYLFKAEGLKNIRTSRAETIMENIWVSTLFQDHKQHVWMGSVNSLHRIDPTISKIAYTYILPKKAEITSLKQDLNGDLWLGSKVDGLFKLRLDQQASISQMNQYTTEMPFCNLAENAANTIFIDRSNTLWIGTYQKGINYTDISSKNFYSFFPLMKNREGIFGYQGKYVSAIAETDQDLWVGTFNEGLFLYNKCSRKIESYKSEISSPSICSIQQSRDKTIYIGGNNGLYRVLNPAGNNRKSIKAIKTGFVARSICEDNRGNLWIASFTGVYCYNPKTNQFKTITTANGISSNSVYAVYQDPYAPIIWLGTIGGGLNAIRYDEAGNYKTSIYRHQENNLNSLSSNHVWCMYRDRRNILWIGTDAGLNALKLDQQGKIISYKTISSPMLSDQKIMAILEDDAKNLWLSSSQGMFRYSINQNIAKRYTYQDGLQSNTLNEAAYKNADGIMYFGGINGLNYFQPKTISNNPFNTSTAFTEFRVANQVVKINDQIDGETILTADINYTKKIVLSYRHKDFALAFSSLHFVAPENNRFRYKLEGYDKNWITTGYNQRMAAYSNLDPGHYRFLLSSTNNDGAYPKEIRSIDFEISPAPWATWWAKTFYFLVFAIAVAFLINYFITKSRLKNEIFKEKLEKEKVTELNEIKLDFFTTITHEIRTPLNLILSPLQDLLSVSTVYDHFTAMRLKIIHRNSLKLHALINQVLDLRKIASDAEKLTVREADLVQILLNVKESFDWQAGQNNIRFDFQSPRTYQAWFDRDKIEKVVFNLLSNAFKYTPSGGKIIFLLQIIDDQANITIQDTGIGIHQSEKDRIFEMYYQSTAHYNSGTGIGLSLSKKLIEMHGGKIELESAVDNGSKFTVTFPVAKAYFNPENIHETAYEENLKVIPAARTKKDEINLSKKTILIIEDNEDQRTYLKECLLPHFHVLDASNGIDGVEIAQKHLPDIVITDLMMPSLDGTDVCRRLKSNAKTGHIPVIVHSINNTSLSVKNALLAGADDFIAKPYDYAMLTLKVNNILKSKNQLVMNIHKQELASPAEVSIPSPDKELLIKIVVYVEENMADNNLSVEKMCDHIGMSRMNLHRRLHAIVGKTASEFIREIRMKRAGQLLASGSKRISEVMFEIGISSNAHFNRYFKEMYGISPKEYIKNGGTVENV